MIYNILMENGIEARQGNGLDQIDDLTTHYFHIGFDFVNNKPVEIKVEEHVTDLDTLDEVNYVYIKAEGSDEWELLGTCN